MPDPSVGRSEATDPLAGLPPCSRCDHSAGAHRLDDATNQDPTSPDAKFRCTARRHLGSLRAVVPCDCPNYLAPGGAS
jgi:hypothetical protein